MSSTPGYTSLGERRFGSVVDEAAEVDSNGDKQNDPLISQTPLATNHRPISMVKRP